MNPFGLGLYEYLSFILPGGLVLFTALIGFRGWTWAEPGASALAGLVAAAFVIGQLVTAVAAWLEPLAWKRKPGSRQQSLDGLFGGGGYYTEAERPEIERLLQAGWGEGQSLQICFDLAYTSLQQSGKDQLVQKMNQELAFNRNMAGATIVSFVIVAIAWITEHDGLEPALWLPALAVATGLFVYRFRRYWRRFAHNVIRGALVLR